MGISILGQQVSAAQRYHGDFSSKSVSEVIILAVKRILAAIIIWPGTEYAASEWERDWFVRPTFGFMRYCRDRVTDLGSALPPGTWPRQLRQLQGPSNRRILRLPNGSSGDESVAGAVSALHRSPVPLRLWAAASARYPRSPKRPVVAAKGRRRSAALQSLAPISSGFGAWRASKQVSGWGPQSRDKAKRATLVASISSAAGRRSPVGQTC